MYKNKYSEPEPLPSKEKINSYLDLITSDDHNSKKVKLDDKNPIYTLNKFLKKYSLINKNYPSQTTEKTIITPNITDTLDRQIKKFKPSRIKMPSTNSINIRVGAKPEITNNLINDLKEIDDELKIQKIGTKYGTDTSINMHKTNIKRTRKILDAHNKNKGL